MLSTQQNSTHTLLDTTSRDNIGLASTAPGESSGSLTCKTSQTGCDSTDSKSKVIECEKLSPSHSGIVEYTEDHSMCEGALQKMSVEPSTQEMSIEIPNDRGSSEEMSTDDPRFDSIGSHDLSELPTELSCNDVTLPASGHDQGEREKKRCSVDRRKTQTKKEREYVSVVLIDCTLYVCMCTSTIKSK